MMREARTLKSLFPEPKPPRRKNFIKENVKSLRRMEQLFHTTNKSAKDNLTDLKQKKFSSKQRLTGDSQVNGKFDSQELDTDIIENGIANMMSSKCLNNDRKARKKSVPVISTKISNTRKLSKPSVNERIVRTNRKECVNRKSDKHKKLKAHSDVDVCKMLNKGINNDETSEKTNKNQGVQTLDTDDISSLYSEGVIRYPSGKGQKNVKPDREYENDAIEGNESDTKNDSEQSLNDNVDYVKLNKDKVSLASNLVSKLNNTAPPPNYRLGIVPKYIKERKEALLKEQLAKATAKQIDCPKGHVALSDYDRKETLSLLKKTYQEYVNELNMLPIKTDTLRAQKRKIEIEKQLSKLEADIKVFSRPKVYVKIDE